MAARQPTIPGLEVPQPEDGQFVTGVRQTIAALRAQGSLQPWHEAICAAAVQFALDAQMLHGVAKANMSAQALAALARLPEPVIEEKGDVVSFELDRVRGYLEAYDAGSDLADVPDQAEPAPVL